MNRLKELRKAKKLSQEDIAKFLGMSQNNISCYELGKAEMPNDILLKLSKYFNVSIDYILGNDKPATKKEISNILKNYDLEKFQYLNEEQIKIILDQAYQTLEKLDETQKKK